LQPIVVHLRQHRRSLPHPVRREATARGQAGRPPRSAHRHRPARPGCLRASRREPEASWAVTARPGEVHALQG
jgi:hypothetical protein